MAGVDLSTCGYGGRVVVALRGELDVAAAAGAAAALAALAAREGEIIIDLAGLELIDCSGLARSRASAGGPGRPTVMCCWPRRNRRRRRGRTTDHS
jgi:hypothetical protein